MRSRTLHRRTPRTSPGGTRFAWCAEHGIDDVEMGVGTWSPRPHLDLDALLHERAARDELRGDLDEYGIRFSAVNAAGNPLHPDPAARADGAGGAQGRDRARRAARRRPGRHDERLPRRPERRRRSGCSALWSICPDDEPLWQWQMEREVGPYWRELSGWTAEAAPDVRICLELHPGVTVFGPWSPSARLRAVRGRQRRRQPRPEPLLVAGRRPARGDRRARRRSSASRTARTPRSTPTGSRCTACSTTASLIDAATAPGTSRPSATGTTVDTWTRLVRALRRAGHDGVVSIEHEDPSLDARGVHRPVRPLPDPGDRTVIHPSGSARERLPDG